MKNLIKQPASQLFWLVIIVGIISISITFYNTVIARNYDIVEVESAE